MNDDTESDFTGTRRFEIIRRLGAGTTGVVYEARDRERRVDVALKVLRSVEPDAVPRIRDELRVLAGLRHPHLVSIGEVFEDDQRLFFTMELVEGMPFLDYVRRTDEHVEHLADAEDTGPLSDEEPPNIDDDLTDQPTIDDDLTDQPVPRDGRLESGADEGRARSAFAQLALGIEALHRVQKIHGDLKPSSIMVTREGRVVILHGALVDHPAGMPPEQRFLGTFSYIAPEQARFKTVGPAADWYTVGVLLFQALTGRLPISGGTREVLVVKQAFEPPAPSVLCDVPEDLDALAVGLLRIDPGSRPEGPEILRLLDADAFVPFPALDPMVAGLRPPPTRAPGAVSRDSSSETSSPAAEPTVAIGRPSVTFRLRAALRRLDAAPRALLVSLALPTSALAGFALLAHPSPLRFVAFAFVLTLAAAIALTAGPIVRRRE